MAPSVLVVNSSKPDNRDPWYNDMLQWTSLFSVFVMYLYLHLPGPQSMYLSVFPMLLYLYLPGLQSKYLSVFPMFWYLYLPRLQSTYSYFQCFYVCICLGYNLPLSSSYLYLYLPGLQSTYLSLLCSSVRT